MLCTYSAHTLRYTLTYVYFASDVVRDMSFFIRDERLDGQSVATNVSEFLYTASCTTALFSDCRSLANQKNNILGTNEIATYSNESNCYLMTAGAVGGQQAMSVADIQIDSS